MSRIGKVEAEGYVSLSVASECFVRGPIMVNRHPYVEPGPLVVPDEQVGRELAVRVRGMGVQRASQPLALLPEPGRHAPEHNRPPER